jgi:glycosyltransferase involved in cell wall biosynthesis
MPDSGYASVDVNSVKINVLSTIRSNLFIPDPRRGWNKYAYKKAKKLISEYNIKTVITTSPPHSSQLIGLKLKKNLNIQWIADFRDPWTDIYYYKNLKHSYLSATIDQYFEKKILIIADKIITVSDDLKKLLCEKSNKISTSKVSVISNGYDAEDFTYLTKSKNARYTITYTSTMAESYSPERIIEALVSIKNKGLDFVLKIVGVVSPNNNRCWPN